MFPQLTPLGMPRHHRRLALGRLLEDAVLCVEAQSRLARVRIRPVTGGAVIREDGTDVPVELHAGIRR